MFWGEHGLGGAPRALPGLFYWLETAPIKRESVCAKRAEHGFPGEPLRGHLGAPLLDSGILEYELMAMPFSPNQLAYADALFRLKIYSSDGQVYEDLFVRVMSCKEEDFRPVKPHGPHGDKKNDGYCGSAGKYYQVHAPEQHMPDQIVATVKKIEDDFEGLKTYWDTLAPVEEYYFVLNDKFKGTYPAIEATFLRLKTKYGLRKCEPLLSKNLVQSFQQLSERDVIGIIGHIPTPSEIADLDFSVFTDVLSHIIKNSVAITPQAFLRVPDFSEKIRLNRISKHVAQLLETGNLQSGAVEGFFDSHGGFSKTAIRDELARIYADLRKKMEPTEGSADVIFFGLLERILPPSTGQSAQQAGIVLLSYFFETCDIYEDPNLL